MRTKQEMQKETNVLLAYIEKEKNTRKRDRVKEHIHAACDMVNDMGDEININQLINI